MQNFDDIAKSKDNRNNLIIDKLPLIQCRYTYSNIVPTTKYANYTDSENISYASSNQGRSFRFPLRELLIDTLNLHDNLPNRDSPEYDKINRQISDYQKRLIK